jgi:hypothetical protein
MGEPRIALVELLDATPGGALQTETKPGLGVRTNPARSQRVTVKATVNRSDDGKAVSGARVDAGRPS